VELLGDVDRVSAVLDDFRGANVSKKDSRLFELIEKATVSAAKITQGDINLARSAGWSDAALYDALTVCALFQFYNTWVDSMGVEELPAAGYDIAGKRLAERGYLPPTQ
jgi:hypothetical protein